MVAMKQEKIGTRNGASTVHDVMSLAMDLTDVRSSVRGRGRYVPTGYVGYDQRVKGLALGKLSIIGSRAGEGHDVLSLDIARHAAAADVPSCFFCPDKSAIEIGRRIMSAEAGVPMETLFSGNDLDEENPFYVTRPIRYVNACLCISRRGGPWMPIASRRPAVD